MPTTFFCGHPRTPENSISSGVTRREGGRYMTCKLCNRVRRIVTLVKVQQERLNRGEPIDRLHRRKRKAAG